MEDFYPMPLFVNLEVTNLDRSAEWYQQALGFREVYRIPGLVHLRRARYQDLLLIPSAPGGLDSPGGGVVIQLQAGELSVDEIADAARQAGSAEVVGPLEQPWNVREVTIHDPDGYRLRFSEPIDTNLSFNEVMGDKRA
jgi:catechol 2,3-dioxygenase-like lactoylglutathione lyase family enzyme